MNDTLKTIFDSYEKEKAKIRKRIDTNKELIKKLDNEVNSYYSGCTSIMQKVNARKENKPAILELEKRLAVAYEMEIVLNTAIKVANEMKVKAVANALTNEIVSNPEKWTKYPLHFQKFKDMMKDFLSGTDLYFSNYMNYGNCYISGCYDYSDTKPYICSAPDGIITQDEIEKLKTKGGYNLIPASDILKECKKAFTARKKIIAKFESAKKEIETMRTPFSSCNTFYNILPYAHDLQNYTRL